MEALLATLFGGVILLILAHEYERWYRPLEALAVRAIRSLAARAHRHRPTGQLPEIISFFDNDWCQTPPLVHPAPNPMSVIQLSDWAPYLSKRKFPFAAMVSTTTGEST
jgi:hypothetical protein